MTQSPSFIQAFLSLASSVVITSEVLICLGAQSRFGERGIAVTHTRLHKHSQKRWQNFENRDNERVEDGDTWNNDLQWLKCCSYSRPEERRVWVCVWRIEEKLIKSVWPVSLSQFTAAEW